MSRNGLSDVILKSLNNIVLNTNYLTDQWYDGVSSMNIRYSDVQKYIRDITDIHASWCYIITL